MINNNTENTNTLQQFNEERLPGISFQRERRNQSTTRPCKGAQSQSVVTYTMAELKPKIAKRKKPGAIGCNNSIKAIPYQTFPSREQHQNTRRPQVRFACHEFLETSHAPPAIRHLSKDWIAELWWQIPELTQMKRFTRSLLITKDREDWIGLDRFSQQRIAYKKKGIKLVLLAQHQHRVHNVSNDPEEFLEKVSKRGSDWSRKVALLIGRRLAAEIYPEKTQNDLAEGESSVEGQIRDSLNASIASGNALVSKHEKKRQLSEAIPSKRGIEADETRRVSMRLSS